jgi:hypothetical protein
LSPSLASPSALVASVLESVTTSSATGFKVASQLFLHSLLLVSQTSPWWALQQEAQKFSGYKHSDNI